MFKFTNPKLSLASSFIFIFVAFYNYMFPLIADDLVRCNIAALLHHTMISQLHWDYINWTGRISAQILIYVFLNNQSLNAITLPIAAIITGICFVVFVRLSYILIFWEEPTDRHINRFIILTLAILFYLNPIHSYTETLGFKTIVIQYFWGTVLIWYILYKLQSRKNTAPTSFIKAFLFFLLGIFLGNYNEIIAAATILYIFFSLVFNSHPKNCLQSFRKNILLSSLFIGNIIGLIALIIAPGNYARQTISMGESNTLNLHYSLWDKIHILFHRYYQIPTKGIFTALVVLLFILAIYLIFSHKQRAQYQQKINYWLKLMLGFAVMLLMLTPIAYYFPGAIAKRITFIPDMLLFYLIFSLVIFNTRFICEYKHFNCARFSVNWKILFAIMLIYFASFLTGAYSAYQFNLARIHEIAQTPNAANKAFVFTAACPNTINRLFGRGLIGSQVGPDPQNTFNMDYAQYYGASSAKEIPCAKS